MHVQKAEFSYSLIRSSKGHSKPSLSTKRQKNLPSRKFRKEANINQRMSACRNEILIQISYNLKSYFNFYVCLSIWACMRPSDYTSVRKTRILESKSTSVKMKVVWSVSMMTELHSWSPSDPQDSGVIWGSYLGQC